MSLDVKTAFLLSYSLELLFLRELREPNIVWKLRTLNIDPKVLLSFGTTK